MSKILGRKRKYNKNLTIDQQISQSYKTARLKHETNKFFKRRKKT